MPRAARIHFSGAIYHCMSRGVDGRVIYADDEDRTTFLRLMRIAERRFHARILAYCLMSNHFHLAVQVSELPLSRFMHWLESSHAGIFNSRHERSGHLFQSRYRAIICLTDRYLLAVIRYIHQNPVRAGLVERAAEWPWSSAKLHSDADDVLPPDLDPWAGDANAPVMLRSESAEMPELEALAAELQFDGESLRSKSRVRPVVEARRRFIVRAMECGHAPAAVARWLGVTEGALRHHLRRGELRLLRA